MLPENNASNVIVYASKADPEYVDTIPQANQEKGVLPLDSLPAQYWNWIWNQMTSQHNLTVATITSILTELQNVLAAAGITPDKATPTQLSEAIKTLIDNATGDLSQLEAGPADTVAEALNSLYSSIVGINSKISSNASSTNKLTDEAFVLRHVATNTANFRGEWPTWSDVPTEGNQYPIDYSGSHDPTENDYMVIRDMSDYGDGSYKGAWQFKYAGDWSRQGKNGWEPEFALGSLIDYDELNQHYAKGTSETLELPNATIDDEGNAVLEGTLNVAKKTMLSEAVAQSLVVSGSVTVDGHTLRICELDTANHALILW